MNRCRACRIAGLAICLDFVTHDAYEASHHRRTDALAPKTLAADAGHDDEPRESARRLFFPLGSVAVASGAMIWSRPASGARVRLAPYVDRIGIVSTELELQVGSPVVVSEVPGQAVPRRR